MIETALIPSTSQSTALEKRLAITILKQDPGMGPKSEEIAHSLCESGLPVSLSIMIIKSVYAPTDPQGRGQGTRAKWFVEMLKNRCSHKLDRIRKDLKQFRVFVADVEDIVEMRDILKGEDCSVSFEGAFLLWEMGLDADSVLMMVEQLCNDMRRNQAIMFILKAAKAVQRGHFMELETAIESMRYGYRYEPEPKR